MTFNCRYQIVGFEGPKWSKHLEVGNFHFNFFFSNFWLKPFEMEYSMFVWKYQVIPKSSSWISWACVYSNLCIILFASSDLTSWLIWIHEIQEMTVNLVSAYNPGERWAPRGVYSRFTRKQGCKGLSCSRPFQRTVDASWKGSESYEMWVS